jgi:hypothetical protein
MLDQSAKVIEYAERSQQLQDYRIKLRGKIRTVVLVMIVSQSEGSDKHLGNQLSAYSPVDGT